MQSTLEDYQLVLESLKPYKTAQEKDAVIKSMDDHSIKEIAEILGAHPSNEFEAMAFIFKLREISIGDLIEITDTCEECKYQNLFQVSIPGMFFKESVSTKVPIGLFESIDEIQDLDSINTLSLSNYNDLEEIVFSNNFKIFDPTVSITCQKCRNVTDIAVNYKDIISKFGIKNIFEQYVDISYYTSMTKQDTDNMYPFEREIFLGLIQVKEDDKNKP